MRLVDDDFDVFEVRSHSAASAVYVVIKLLVPSHAPGTNIAGPSAVTPASGPVTVEGSISAIGPPLKKRKIDGNTSVKPVSSAPGGIKRKSNAALIEDASASISHATPDPASEELESQNKKRKKVKKNPSNVPSTVPPADTDAPAPEATDTVPELVKKRPKKVAEVVVPPVSSITSGARGQPSDSSAPESVKKRSKKIEKDVTLEPVPSTSGDVAGAEDAVGDRRKRKSKKAVDRGLEAAPPSEQPAEENSEAAPSKASLSEKSTKKSKKDQTEGADGSAHKSVKFTFPEALARAISSSSDAGALAQNEQVSTSHQESQNPAPSEKAKKTKGKKKVVDVGSSEQVQPQESPIDPKSMEEFWNSLKKAAPTPTSDTQTQPEATKGGKNVAGQSKNTNQIVAKEQSTTAALCPICETSPFHLRYRCPVVLAGAGRIRQRIAELQQDEETDNSKLIQELRSLAAKSQKTADADPKEGSTSNISVIRKQTAAMTSSSRPDPDDSDSSSDESRSAPLRKKTVAPPPVVDSELEAIIRGPVASRLTVDDVLMEDEDEEEPAESRVLENDDEDDIKFRRRSRQLDTAASSGEDDDDEESFSAGEVAESEPPLVVNTSVRADSPSPAQSEKEPPFVKAVEPAAPPDDGSNSADSRRSSLRSQTVPLGAIEARQSQTAPVDMAGDIAVGDAMASDQVMFGLDAPDANNGGDAESVADSPRSPPKSSPILLTPTQTRLRSQSAAVKSVRPGDDPIQPAEDFPPTPIQPHKVPLPSSPSTPKSPLKSRMKDRNGKIPVKLSQLELPFSFNPQTQTQPPETELDDSLVPTQPAEEPAEKTITRRSTRSMANLPVTAPEAEQPTKRRRGPNKTAEQRAEEAAAKVAAKEEKERLRKEKAEAKEKEKAAAKGKGKSAKAAGKNAKHHDVLDTQDCTPTDAVEAEHQPNDSPLALSVELPRTRPTHSREPMSQDEWTVLKPNSPNEEESLRDELRSSSEAPLFLPAESQVPFPYSQWNNAPEVCPGSPKESLKDSEDEEEEVAASMNLSQRPVNGSTYRRLTDIASQPSLFSKTETLPAFRPASLPSAKDKRDQLYGKLPQEYDDSTDSDDSAADAPSHIPKSRRAGIVR
ncbi:Carbamoyl-phosphate synthase arginine-specific small chain [Mycena sanguinolenta]|uniref:Carbamoyl-phosphate synthase arginine-specific small chain n=1 Tax=Mycena sanguinolenta TaxID=230812 RepID=A0A8H6ZEL1_9AGAR|nr:Carbamoyl-phosphate synthase arginine-specific small chain [Mycena sanguinolenta]